MCKPFTDNVNTVQRPRRLLKNDYGFTHYIMGYLTTYRLEVSSQKDEIFDFLTHALCKNADTIQCLLGDGWTPKWYEHVENMRSLLGDGWTTTWYEHVEDMRKISIAYPKVQMILHGLGEDSGDEWIESYYGGQYTPLPLWLDYLESHFPADELEMLRKRHRRMTRVG